MKTILLESLLCASSLSYFTPTRYGVLVVNGEPQPPEHPCEPHDSIQRRRFEEETIAAAQAKRDRKAAKKGQKP